MVAIIFGILFFMAIYYHDKSKDQEKLNERIRKENRRKEYFLNQKLLKAKENEKKIIEKEFANHKTDIESLKHKANAFKLLTFENNDLYIEFVGSRGNKYLISYSKSSRYLQNIISTFSKKSPELSDLSYLNWFEELGTFSLFEDEEQRKFRRIRDGLLTNYHKGNYKVLTRLNKTWEIIYKIDEQSDYSFANSIKNYIKLAEAPSVKKGGTVPNNL